MNSRNLQEDTSSLAGWMFADLFLALTVIFLATVSFIPSGKVNDSNTKDLASAKLNYDLLTKSQITLISNGFINTYQKDDTRAFGLDLEKYLENRDLPNNTKALYLEVLGHTDSAGELNDLGNLSALNFVINARKDQAKHLDTTTTSINLSPDVPSGFIKIKVTFT